MISKGSFSRGEHIAAVCWSPSWVTAAVSPQVQVLQALRDACDEHGALLIIDEGKSVFGLPRVGHAELYGIHGDLTTYAQAMGNGYPLYVLADEPK